MFLPRLAISAQIHQIYDIFMKEADRSPYRPAHHKLTCKLPKMTKPGKFPSLRHQKQRLLGIWRGLKRSDKISLRGPKEYISCKILTTVSKVQNKINPAEVKKSTNSNVFNRVHYYSRNLSVHISILKDYIACTN